MVVSAGEANLACAARRRNRPPDVVGTRSPRPVNVLINCMAVLSLAQMTASGRFFFAFPTTVRTKARSPRCHRRWSMHPWNAGVDERVAHARDSLLNVGASLDAS
jgi:hypothetical protein